MQDYKVLKEGKEQSETVKLTKSQADFYNKNHSEENGIKYIPVKMNEEEQKSFNLENENITLRKEVASLKSKLTKSENKLKALEEAQKTEK